MENLKNFCREESEAKSFSASCSVAVSFAVSFSALLQRSGNVLARRICTVIVKSAVAARTPVPAGILEAVVIQNINSAVDTITASKIVKDVIFLSQRWRRGRKTKIFILEELRCCEFSCKKKPSAFAFFSSKFGKKVDRKRARLLWQRASH